MKRIFLLRHAKSSWADPSLRDRDRPLNGRGKRAAKAIARHLREEGIDPQLVLCSSATRTLETLERIEGALSRRSVQVEDGLYGAAGGALLERLRAVPDSVEAVMVIAHNPGLEDLTLQLARDAPLVREVEAKFPTAALATLEFDGARWADLAPGQAELVAFVRPRDL